MNTPGNIPVHMSVNTSVNAPANAPVNTSGHSWRRTRERLPQFSAQRGVTNIPKNQKNVFVSGNQFFALRILVDDEIDRIFHDKFDCGVPRTPKAVKQSVLANMLFDFSNCSYFGIFDFGSHVFGDIFGVRTKRNPYHVLLSLCGETRV